MRSFVLVALFGLVAMCSAASVDLSSSSSVPPLDYNSYLKARAALIAEERGSRFDAHLPLSPLELAVNDSLMAHKQQEYLSNMDYWPPTLNFPEAQPLIDKSWIFSFLKDMPKGAVLHTHSGSSTSFHFLIKNGTYNDECYIYIDSAAPTFKPGTYIYAYSEALRNKQDIPFTNGSIAFWPVAPSDKWVSVQDRRAQYASPEDFDQALYESLMLGGGFVNGIDAWKRFDILFSRVGRFLSYKPVVTAYLNQFITNLLADNMIYVEIRQLFGFMYDFEHGQYSPEEEIQLVMDIVAERKKESPNFVGLKFIYSGLRHQNKTQVMGSMVQALKLRAEFPSMVVGFDLVGEEHAGHTTLFFLEEFIEYARKENASNIDLPYYFHGGESDWYFNENLYDVILLGTKRIGHGYALSKHPLLMDKVKELQIAIEVCPISNQMLRLLSDLRNHPAATFIAEGVPFVLSYDDPAMYNYTTMAYDFWEGFMSWDMDLRSLKQLAMNSIQYSALEGSEKERAWEIFRDQWSAFIQRQAMRLSITVA